MRVCVCVFVCVNIYTEDILKLVLHISYQKVIASIVLLNVDITVEVAHSATNTTIIHGSSSFCITTKLSSIYCTVSIIAQQQMDGKRSGDRGILMNGHSVHVCVKCGYGP